MSAAIGYEVRGKLAIIGLNRPEKLNALTSGMLAELETIAAGLERRDDIRVVKVPMTEIAAEHENPKGANIVMMGAMAANSDLFTEDDLERLINEFFEKKGKINPKNSLCFRAGTQIH